MQKTLILIFLFSMLFIFNGCKEKDPEIFLLTITDMTDQIDTYYLGYGVEFTELTKQTSILQNAFINVPFEDVMVVDNTNEHRLDNWLSQKQYEMPFKLVEGKSYLIIFSSNDIKIHDATELTLDFNDYSFVYNYE